MPVAAEGVTTHLTGPPLPRRQACRRRASQCRARACFVLEARRRRDSWHPAGTPRFGSVWFGLSDAAPPRRLQEVFRLCPRRHGLLGSVCLCVLSAGFRQLPIPVMTKSLAVD